jgi:hypothetical protein
MKSHHPIRPSGVVANNLMCKVPSATAIDINVSQAFYLTLFQ